MRPIIIILAALMLTACANDSDQCDPMGTPRIDSSRDGILVIGDSISLGYTPFIEKSVQNAEVTHNACNGESSTNGVSLINRWVSYRPHWKVITLNHGYWDLPGGAQASSLAVYEANLRYEVGVAVSHADTVILVNTTQIISAFTAEYPLATNAEVAARNAVIATVAASYGIHVVDLYGVSTGIPDRDSSLLHFNPSGYQALGAAVYAGIQTFGGIN